MMPQREADSVWNGMPVFRCRICGPRFERVNNLPAVLEHEAEKHAMPAPTVRESSILGPDGQPMLVQEG
jgi:hypothetical protein